MRMVSNSTADQTAGYLASKIVAGSNIVLSVVDPGGDEKLSIASAGGGGSAIDISAQCTGEGFSIPNLVVWMRALADGKRINIDCYLSGMDDGNPRRIILPVGLTSKTGTVPAWVNGCFAAENFSTTLPSCAIWIDSGSNIVQFKKNWTSDGWASGAGGCEGSIQFEIP